METSYDPPKKHLLQLTLQRTVVLTGFFWGSHVVWGAYQLTARVVENCSRLPLQARNVGAFQKTKGACPC